jgi:hypothetical protein
MTKENRLVCQSFRPFDRGDRPSDRPSEVDGLARALPQQAAERALLAELVLHLQSEEPLLRELDRSQDNTDLTPVHMLVSPRFPSLRGPL